MKALKGGLLVIAGVFFWSMCQGQHVLIEDQPHYDMSFKKVYPHFLASTGFYIAGQVIRRNADPPNMEDILELDAANIGSFDRGAIYNNSEDIARASDFLLYGSLALPAMSFLNPKIRQEGSAVVVMLFESVLLADGITNMIKGSTKRYRPFTYNPEVLLEDKLKPNARQSFISGHTSICASMSFMTARVITHVHPDTKYKGLIWGAAIALPAVTGFLRYQAGRHFPTDIIGGYAVGVGVGLLIPELQKHTKINVGPTDAGIGITLLLD